MDMAYTTNEHVGKVRVQAIRLLKQGKSTIVKWNKRQEEIWHQKQLPTRSSRSKSHPNALPPELVAQVIQTRIRLKRCSEVVCQQLKTDGVMVSLSSVKRILGRRGLLKKPSPWKKPRKYPIRPDVQKP